MQFVLENLIYETGSLFAITILFKMLKLWVLTDGGAKCLRDNC